MFKEMGYDVACSTTFARRRKAMLPVAGRYLHDTMKAALEEPSFTAFLKGRALEADYSAGDRLKAVLWEDYREHTTACSERSGYEEVMNLAAFANEHWRVAKVPPSALS